MLFTFKIVCFNHCQLKSTSFKLNKTWCSGLALKFTKVHVRACGISKFSPGVIPPNPRKKGKGYEGGEDRGGRGTGSRWREDRFSCKANFTSTPLPDTDQQHVHILKLLYTYRPIF